MPSASDKSDKNIKRYEAYLERANFVNYTANTKEGLIGLVFRKETKTETPKSIDYLKNNANGNGLSLDQIIKYATGEVLQTGRIGVLTEYPQADAGLTDAQVKALNLRANIVTYPAESIINWRTTTIGGIKKLSLVVLKEETREIEGFESEEKTQYRVLMLKDGVYVQNIYNEDLELLGVTDGDTFNSDIIPRKASGETWKEIPFSFIGSVNNDEQADKSPLYDIAEINISHYRNSADYEESCFIVGQPTYVFTGLTQTWIKDNFKDGVSVGSRGGVLLPQGANGSLLQAQPNQMPLEGMREKEKQMIAIGARLIADTKGNETAEAAKIRFSGQNSKLGSLLKNVENGFIKCLEWAIDFMGGDYNITLEINKEFYDATLDPQTIMAAIQLQDRGVIAVSDTRDLLRRGGIIRHDRTDEEISGEAEITPIM